MIHLRLYIIGKTGRSENTVNHLNEIFRDEWAEEYSLEVIDVIENPDLAEQDRIFVTPTLIKVSPEPAQRIVGDLRRKDLLLPGLGLVQAE